MKNCLIMFVGCFPLLTILLGIATAAAADTDKLSQTQLSLSQTAAPEQPVAEYPSAHALVESTTVELLALIQQAKDYIDEDETRFYGELEQLLRPFIDFRSFARAVMGKHASSKKMAGLEPGERDQLDKQIDRFSDVFSQALIRTYGKGLLAFEGERIEVVPSDKSGELAAKKNKAQVKQLIFGDRQEPYEIYYSLRKNKENQWKLRNMVIESVNLGKIYRNQFDNAYQVYGGDIDRVIENWVVNTDSDKAES